jgi:hypothetical protein
MQPVSLRHDASTHTNEPIAPSRSEPEMTRYEPQSLGTRVVRAADAYAVWLAERERERRCSAMSTTPARPTRLARGDALKQSWSRIPIKLSPHLW